MTGPRQPADLTGLTLAELARVYGLHAGALVDARHGIGQPQTPTDLAGHAVAALAAQHALAARALEPRWLHVVDALTYGADLAQVSAAMDLTDDEVRVGLRSWISGQVEARRLTPPDADEALNLIGGDQ